MKHIYKYPIIHMWVNQFEINLDKVLTIQFQNGIPCLWAVVDDENPCKTVDIIKLGTGWDIDSEMFDLDEFNYITTIQEDHTGYVWHFFYKIHEE